MPIIWWYNSHLDWRISIIQLSFTDTGRKNTLQECKLPWQFWALCLVVVLVWKCLEVVSVSQFQSDTTTALTYPTFKSSLPPAPRAGVDSKSLLRIWHSWIIAEYILSWPLKILINHDMDQLMIRLSGQRLRGIQVKYYLSSDLENYATCFWRPSCCNSINSNYHRLLTREIFLQREKT